MNIFECIFMTLIFIAILKWVLTPLFKKDFLFRDKEKEPLNVGDYVKIYAKGIRCGFGRISAIRENGYWINTGHSRSFFNSEKYTFKRFE